MPRKVIDLKTYEIDADLIDKFEALEPAAKKPTWTPEKDALLLKYWEDKNKHAVSELLGVTPNTARKRFRELTSDS